MEKVIRNYKDYTIDEYGNVRSYKRKKPIIMKPKKDKDGYLIIGLTDKNKKQKYFRIHRLVAEAFIENPNNLPIINHKDCKRNNNHYLNLEWCDYTYNNQYTELMGRSGNKITVFKKIKLHILETGENKEFNTIKELSTYLDLNYDYLRRLIQGKYKNSKVLEQYNFEIIDYEEKV